MISRIFAATLVEDSVAGYRRWEGEFVLLFNNFIEYYLTSAPFCVDLTAGEETNTSKADDKGDNSNINLSQYPDLADFTRLNADDDVGGGGLAGCYYLHPEDYDDNDHDDDDNDVGIWGIGGGTTTTSVNIRVVLRCLASVEQRELDRLVVSELHCAANFYVHTLLMDIERHLPSLGDGNDWPHVNKCYNKNDDDENVDRKDAGNGGGG
jgi:hypothetical protein